MQNHATSVAERRRATRWQLTHPMPIVADDEQRTFFGHALNVSADGILIETKNEIAVEKKLMLLLQLPSHQEGGTQEVLMECVAKWSVYNDKAKQTHLGCCFIDIDSEELARALTFVMR